MKEIKKTITPILPSLFLLVLAFITEKRAATLPESVLHTLLYLPYVVFLTGIAVAWKFNCGRILFNLIVMSVSFYALGYQGDYIGGNDLIIIGSILIPLNILIFSSFKERGILSVWGLLRFLFLFAQFYFFIDFVHGEQQLWKKMIEWNVSAENNAIFHGIPDIATIIFGISFIVMMIRIIKYQSSQDGAFACILVLLCYSFTDGVQADWLLYSAAGLILILSILSATYFMAFYDELTRLPSRRALKQDMLKLGMKYSIAMTDIDFFKKFNDTYGHDTGDDVLRLVASELKTVGGGGKAYRYGGEEFTIVFPGKCAEDTVPYLEELRERIEQSGFLVKTRKSNRKRTTTRKKISGSKKGSGKKAVPAGMKRVKITISIGVAEKGEDARTTDLVMKEADKALYRAKKQGRNCVCS